MSAPVFMICTVQIQEVWRAGIPFRTASRNHVGMRMCRLQQEAERAGIPFRPASRNHVGMRMCRLQQEAPLPAAFFFILQERASYKTKNLRAGSHCGGEEIYR